MRAALIESERVREKDRCAGAKPDANAKRSPATTAARATTIVLVTTKVEEWEGEYHKSYHTQKVPVYTGTGTAFIARAKTSLWNSECC